MAGQNPNRKLFVKGLSPHVDDATVTALLDHLAGQGSVISVAVKKRQTHAFAFIEFNNHAAAEKCVCLHESCRTTTVV
jgi:hypothetical protein